jgi:hypothetical protein
MRQSLHQIITFHHFLPNLLPTTMSSNAAHEEAKIQEAMALLRKHPKMKATEAARFKTTTLVDLSLHSCLLLLSLTFCFLLRSL